MAQVVRHDRLINFKFYPEKKIITRGKSWRNSIAQVASLMVARDTYITLRNKYSKNSICTCGIL